MCLKQREREREREERAVAVTVSTAAAATVGTDDDGRPAVMTSLAIDDVDATQRKSYVCQSGHVVPCRTREIGR